MNIFKNLYNYRELIKSSVKKDIALVVDKDVEALELAKAIKNACGNSLRDIEVFDVYEGTGIEERKKKYSIFTYI